MINNTALLSSYIFALKFMKSQSDSESNAQSEQSYHTEVASEMSEEMSVSGTKVITLSAGTFTFL